MKRILIVLIVIVFSKEIYSQTITVVETKQITNDSNGEYYFPHFSNNDTEIIFTKSNYVGLYRMDIKNKEIKQITDENGAGYKPLISKVNNDIFYKSFILKNGRKFNSLKKYDLQSRTTKIIENEKRLLKLPVQTNYNKVAYLVNSKFKIFALENVKLSKTNIEQKALFVENDQLYLGKNNSTKTLSPLGKGVYVWESFSEDGNKVVFTFENKGVFVSDLEGNILKNIPEAHYPKFSPNGKYILYMIDKDNGYSYISSDIFIYSLVEGKSYPITNTDNKIEMYAEWSHSGDSIIYHTENGEIYLIKLDIQN